MATLDSSAVTAYPTNLSRDFYPDKTNRHIVSRSLKLVLTGQGGATNTITAAALGFNTLLSCSNACDVDQATIWATAINPVTNVLLIGNTDGVPTDTTSNALYITVTGTPKLAR